MLPFCVSCVSIVIVSVQLWHLRGRLHGRSPEPTTLLTPESPDDSLAPGDREIQSTPLVDHVAELGGPIIFAWMTVRALGCFILLGISMTPWTKVWVFHAGSHIFDALRLTTASEKAIVASNVRFQISLTSPDLPSK